MAECVIAALPFIEHIGRTVYFFDCVFGSGFCVIVRDNQSFRPGSVVTVWHFVIFARQPAVAFEYHIIQKQFASSAFPSLFADLKLLYLLHSSVAPY